MPENTVPADFVKIEDINSLPLVTEPLEGKILYYDEEDQEAPLKTAEIKGFRKEIQSGIVGEATTSSSPTVYNPTDYPDGLYEKYDIKTAGTYTNFKDSTNTAIVVTSGDLSNNFVQIWVKNGVSQKVVTPLPNTNYNTGTLNPSSITAAETGKTISNYVAQRVAIQDTLFQKTLVDNGVKQLTAANTATNQTLGTKTGISMSLGTISSPGDKVTIKFAQSTSTPVTQIEIRLFQGKTAGGTLIAKKRVTITAASTAQTSATITFDSPINYTGEMWCEILMNNPFEYYKVTTGAVRTAAAGYGQPKYTTVNDLDNTTFSTNLTYSDLYLEFNTLVDQISLTTTGASTLISPTFDSSATNKAQSGNEISKRYDPYLYTDEPFLYTTEGTTLSMIATNRTIVRNLALTKAYTFRALRIFVAKSGIIQVGIFDKPASTTMKAVSYTAEITVNAGDQIIDLPASLTAAAGQYIGIYCKTAQIYVDTTKAGQLGGDRVYTAGRIDVDVTQTTTGTSNYDLFSLLEYNTIPKKLEQMAKPQAYGVGVVPSSNAVAISGATPNPIFLKDSWVVNGKSINQPLHPTVMAFPGLFNGYKYVMVQTPYPQSGNDIYKDRYEVPFLHFSQDRVNWTAGQMMDDLTLEEIAAESYMSDPDLVFNTSTNQLEVWYRITHRAARATEGTTIGTQLLRKIINTDGTWSARQVLLTEAQMQSLAGEIRSHGVLYEGGVYKLWFTGLTGGNVGFAQTSNPADFSTWTVSPVTMTGQLANCWHLDVVRDGSDIYLINDTINFDLHLFKWVSNTQFTFVKVLLERTNNPKDYYGKVVYRSSGIVESGLYSLFVSGWNDDGGRGVASVGLMEGDSFSNLKHVDGNFPRHERRQEGNFIVYNGLFGYADGAGYGYDPATGIPYFQDKNGKRYKWPGF